MSKNLLLFIDESGNCDPRNKQSDYYVVCGCCVPENKKDQLKISADHIKFKYWGRTDVVFHSRDLYSNREDFNIFKNKPHEKNEFLKDLFIFLKQSPIILIIVLLEKKDARKKGWNKIKVLKETSYSLIYHFIALLFSNSSFKGKIIIESATTEKDRYFLNSFSYFLSPGFTEFDRDFIKTRKVLTSISFVTKDNFDTEEQIADLFAYTARCKFEKEKKNRKFEKDCYETKMISILEQKLFKQPYSAKENKMRFYRKIKPFLVLP